MAHGRLRVVAGRAGGLRLEVPPGDAVRPTTERVREALFSSLGPSVAGATVLDLYAGSGALAIEALSRGAAAAVCVERDRRVADVVARNLAHTGCTGSGRVVARTATAFLDGPPPPEAPFTLVCCDPPYDADPAEVDAVLLALARPGWCAGGATVVLERRVGAADPVVPAGWERTVPRTYGDTLVERFSVGSSDPSRTA